MAQVVTQEVKRDVEKFKSLQERYRACNSFYFEEQEQVIKDIKDFFKPEIETAVNYTGKLPSFRNCGGSAGRRALLEEEALLVACKYMIIPPEEYGDFETFLEKFREEIRGILNTYSQQAQRESFHVETKNDRRTNEGEQCTVVSGGKDITEEACNPNYKNEGNDPEDEDASDFMDCNMGPNPIF